MGGYFVKRELIDDILDPDYQFDFDDNMSHDIETVCLNCGEKELVPNYIYDEFSKKKYHFKLKKKAPTITCMSCQKDTAVPSSYLNN